MTAAERNGAPPELKRVFIVGFPRSGTTWAMWLLAQHPEVVVFQQSGLFHALQPLVEWWDDEHKFSHKSGDEREGRFAMKDKGEVLDQALLHERCRDLCDAVFRRIAAESPGARVIVEQTPENVRFGGLLQGVYPEAYFLHVVRDPRAAVASMQSASRSWGAPGGFPTSLVQSADAWRRYVALARDLRARGARVHDVRYEDLKADAPAELAKILEWIGLAHDEASCRAAVEACSIDKLRERTKAPAGFYRRGQAEGWRSDLSRSAQRTIEYLAREEMARWGYEPEHPRADRKPLRLLGYEWTAAFTQWVARKRVMKRPLRRMKDLERTMELMGGKLP